MMLNSYYDNVGVFKSILKCLEKRALDQNVTKNKIALKHRIGSILQELCTTFAWLPFAPKHDKRSHHTKGHFSLYFFFLTKQDVPTITIIS